MACRGCAQTGDCACAVVGDGGAITVTGTGGPLDPYVITFTGSDFLSGLIEADPDLCTEDWHVVAQRDSDGLTRLIPAPKRCAVIL